MICKYFSTARRIRGLGLQTVLLATLATTALGVRAQADGQQHFRGCAACHSTEPGDHRTGPSLARIFGRTAGTIEDFPRYSSALRESGLNWDAATLDRWLENPAGLVPGTTMAFPGIPEAEARHALIGYLETLARNGNTPRAAVTPPLPDLKQLSALQSVQAIRHCGDSYYVTVGDGSEHPFWEFNLRFKTDTSARGPLPGQPVIVGQGMRGDRAQIVFAAPAEISTFINSECELPENRK
ncbi:MAG: c-type cytochrome [Azoarcus sp.]|nr:c-type cytochrome [Azoarcus sp.]